MFSPPESFHHVAKSSIHWLGKSIFIPLLSPTRNRTRTDDTWKWKAAPSQRKAPKIYPPFDLIRERARAPVLSENLSVCNNFSNIPSNLPTACRANFFLSPSQKKKKRKLWSVRKKKLRPGICSTDLVRSIFSRAQPEKKTRKLSINSEQTPRRPRSSEQITNLISRTARRNGPQKLILLWCKDLEAEGCLGRVVNQNLLASNRDRPRKSAAVWRVWLVSV